MNGSGQSSQAGYRRANVGDSPSDGNSRREHLSLVGTRILPSLPILAAALVAGSLISARAAESLPSPHRAAWMQQAKWGVMVHYLADWKAGDHKLDMTVEKWNQLVDGFDADGLAEQMKSVGAGYLILTLGQNSGYYLAPNPTYDRLTGITPSKCSRRDLMADVSAALRKRNLKLIAYLPSGAPSGDRTAREALQWQGGAHANKEFQQKWEQVIHDWSVRWGDRIDGWWFDGCYWPNTMYRTKTPPNFESFATAARAGNSRNVVAFNPGVIPRLISLTPDEDYTAGEINDPATVQIRRSLDGKLDGAQVQVLSHLGRTWGRGEPRYATEQVVQHSQGIRTNGGVITWDVPVELNGRIPESFLVQLRAVNRALNSSNKPSP
jgi:alpha-L-fucosidase